ncbi:shikimate kinase [Weissella cibaria]|uniref:Shikimate kinase n=1 Tax=Weissella cibaria TaxID=137591 RepID=A0A0D1JW33_9LACO|nr:shikimate kinase [Weissella cibaria]KIU25433.1 Shikimate kinase 1 [Weissella cibaria]TVV36346.1 shikimate kinase [Weissella cibaria]
MKTAVLIGFMGAGKTTVGHELAELLGLPLIDTDKEIIRRTGQTPGEIFVTAGEASFRELEYTVLQDVIHKGGVIATGGGIVETPGNIQLLSEAGVPVYYLSGSFGQTLERLADDDTRPILRTKTLLEVAALWRSRLPKYDAAATTTVQTDGKTPRDIARLIQIAFEG